jgi:isopentenyl-diphosphate delta-isomerase type 1
MICVYEVFLLIEFRIVPSNTFAAPMQEERVILVNEADEAIGTMEKMEAHEKAVLHRAFSVFVFDTHGRMLLQRRAMSKYHSGGLWTNSCCSHPREGETTLEAAHRRLQEEMGFDCPLEARFNFIYRAELDQGLTEYELDHVFTGIHEGEIHLNTVEVMEYRYISWADLDAELTEDASQYTEWFKIALPEVRKQLSVSS